MDDIDLLRNIEMFEGLSDKQIKKLADVFEERVLQPGEDLFRLGDKADHLYLVKDGFIELIVGSPSSDSMHVIRNLGLGQSFGEMSWVDRGLRSATARAATENTLIVYVSFEALDEICDKNPKIGYRIFRNIAADLSFRLRQDTEKN